MRLDYYYPNNQAARFLWYHDHAMHFVSLTDPFSLSLDEMTRFELTML
jgi:hypothetical protein